MGNHFVSALRVNLGDRAQTPGHDYLLCLLTDQIDVANARIRFDNGLIANLNTSRGVYFQFLRTALMASLKGAAPMVAIEFGRRAIPPSVRPSFQQMEATCRSGGAAASAETVPKAA